MDGVLTMKIRHIIFKKSVAVILCIALIFLISVPALSASEKEILRVAFYPLDGFFQYDSQGNEIGYGVELLNKISQYTGIEFDYVSTDSWENTKYMLINGEADVRMPATKPSTPSTVLSYNETSILDTYHVLLTLNSRNDLYYQDYDTIKTLKIAISESFYTANSVQYYFDQIGVSSDQLVFCSEYNECRDKLMSGEVDALVSNIMDMDSNMKMLARFNSISNYISMPLNNPNIERIDEALAQIKLDEPLFLSSEYAKWFPQRTTVPLTLEESEYLSSVETVTFAFQPNEGYLSHYENGEYFGIYPEMAKCICDKLGVKYNSVSIPDCLDDKAKTDVYAGFFYDKNYAEQWNFCISAPLNDINYYIIQRKETTFDPDTCRIAAIEKFKYTSDYLQNQYKNAQFMYYSTYEECLQAVASGKVDMTVINNYIAEYYLGMYQFSNLSARLSTEYSHLFCFATADNNELLASIITKGISMISDEEMSQLYILGQEKRPESNYIQAALYQNPLQFILVIAGVIALIIIAIMLFLFAHKIRQQNRVLENALNEKNNFLARMSHDMRTPMNGILGLSYIMEQQDDKNAIKECIPQLRESGEYLLQLINDVLDVNRIESGKLTLNPRVCNEAQLFNSIIDMLKPQFEEKEISFSFNKINIEWQYMLLDEQRVKQIFINLLSNAIKFTPRGGKIDFVMELVSQTDAMIRDKFIVRDNGIGMSKEFLPHIFEPFAQEGRVNIDSTNGTGLGLPIVKQLVELMDGTISIESEEGKGTEVTLFINFPLAQKPLESSEEAEKNSDRENLKKNLNILICEDNELNAKILIKLLERQQAVVTWAENGEIGVQKFKQSDEGFYDVILMDIRMPVMDGLTAAQEIRKQSRTDAKTVPIIAVTANAYEDDVQKAIASGMNAHLSKPIEPNILFKILKKYTG